MIDPPLSTAIVVMLSIGVNIMYGAGRKYLTDIEKTKRVTRELKVFNKEFREAVTNKNKSKEEKMMKKKKQMDQLQAKIMMDNMKVTGLFLIPLMAAYYGVGGIIGSGFLAISPVQIPLIFFTLGPQLDFFQWYIISSLALSGMITKALGAGMD